MVEVQLVKSTEVIKTFKVEQNSENFKTTFSVSCEWMDQEDYHNAQYELEQLGRDIKDLIFAHRNRSSSYVAVPVVTDEPMYKPGPLPCEEGLPETTEKCLAPGGVKVNRLTLFHMRRIIKEVLGQAAAFGSKEECLDIANQIVNRIADEAADDVLEGRGERVYLENQTFSMMEPTSDPIPLGCWSNESLLKVATGKVVSLEYSQLDAAGELVFRLNSSMPEGVELRFMTDRHPYPALDAPAERKKERAERMGEDIYKDAKKSLSIDFTYEDYGRPRVQGEPVGAIVAESCYPAVGSKTHSGRSLICRDFIHIEHQSPLKDVEQLKEKIWQQARMIIDQLVSDS